MVERSFGIHLSYWQSTWTDNLRPLIGKAYHAGYNVAEFPVLFPTQLNYAELRDELDMYGMAASCSTGLGIDADLTSSDKSARQAGIAFIKACVKVAVGLGSPVLVGVTYAPWGFFPTDDISERRKHFLSSLREISNIAEDQGITLCIEIINRYEGYLINTVDEGLAVIGEIGSPGLKLHLDTYHMNIEEDDIGDAIRKAGSSLGHLHCSENNRKIPGEGHIPWKDVAKAINDIDYNGYIVAETFVNPAGEVGRGLYIWRTMADDLDESAQKAAIFLKSVFSSD